MANQRGPMSMIALKQFIATPCCGAGEPHTAPTSATMSCLLRFARDDAAISAIEYALIAGLVTLGIVVFVRLIGTTLSSTYYGPLLAGF
ncbi:MAG: Flp family type IVb pilin [Methylocapsa sp.]|nr:Flp family type IVb pilin [Methylocapsa sp.]